MKKKFTGKIIFNRKKIPINYKYYVGKKRINYIVKNKKILKIFKKKPAKISRFGKFECYSIGSKALYNIVSRKIKNNEKILNLMFKNINYKKNLKFSNLSRDKNKIHLNKSFAKNYFFQKPVVHGAHLALIGITKYLNKNTNLLIKNIDVRFKNFCLVNEKFKINIKKKNINISGFFRQKYRFLS